MTYAGFPHVRKRSGKGENRISLGLEKVSKVWNGSGFRWEHARGDHFGQQNGLRWDRANGLKSTWCSYNQGHVEFTLNGMETLHPEPASGCTGESYRSNCWREETSSNGNVFHVTGPLWEGIHRSPVASLHKGQWRVALKFFLWSASEQQTIEMPVIWETIVLFMTSL